MCFSDWKWRKTRKSLSYPQFFHAVEFVCYWFLFQLLVCVSDVSAAEWDEMKRKSMKEGESVILYTVVIKNPNDLIMWYFNNTRIAEITGDQSEICTDDQCKERFRDRLKLDHQTGSLTIMNTRTTDSGLYQLQITSSSRISIIKSFNVTLPSEYHLAIYLFIYLFPLSSFRKQFFNQASKCFHCSLFDKVDLAFHTWNNKPESFLTLCQQNLELSCFIFHTAHNLLRVNVLICIFVASVSLNGRTQHATCYVIF